MDAFNAILIPSDLRPTHIVTLTVSVPAGQPHVRFPHPEVHMDLIARGDSEKRAWSYQLVEALDGMTKMFTHPYIIFFPVISINGLPFPVNLCIRQIQESYFRNETAWRGDIVIAKYSNASNPWTSLVDASMADFPIVRNYFMRHYPRKES